MRPRSVPDDLAHDRDEVPHAGPHSTRHDRILPAALLPLSVATAPAAEGDFAARLRSRREDPKRPGLFALSEVAESWDPRRTALLVCDMWDLHHCLNAAKPGGEMAPTIDRVLKLARDRGAVIIHAPSDCMDSYKDHPGRRRAMTIPRSGRGPIAMTRCRGG